jgi:putative PIN family toxin of toxin-antitoxin system
VRAVFDTNIVVSALIFGGRLAWLRGAWASGTLVPVICRQTTAELLRVLAYPKFRLSAEDRAGLLEDYLPYAEIITLPDPVPPLAVTCRDRKDAIFLSLAIAAGIPLVSGDIDLTVLRGSAPIAVLSVTDLAAKLRE